LARRSVDLESRAIGELDLRRSVLPLHDEGLLLPQARAAVDR